MPGAEHSHPPSGWNARSRGPAGRAATTETLASDIDELGDMIASLSERIDGLAVAKLTTEDVAAIRVIIEQDRRVRWLWASARTGALWISAVVVGVTVGLDGVKAILRRLLA